MTTPHAVHFCEVADAVDVERIPRAQFAVLAYVDGHWPTVTACQERFPQSLIITVATSARHDAMVLDVEAGDATLAQAVAWVRRHLAEHHLRPCVYVPLSATDELLAQMHRAGVERLAYRLWTAHWTGKPHLCDRERCGLQEKAPGATQWSSADEHHPYDRSLSSRAWLTALARDSSVVHSELI